MGIVLLMVAGIPILALVILGMSFGFGYAVVQGFNEPSKTEK